MKQVEDQGWRSEWTGVKLAWVKASVGIIVRSYVQIVGKNVRVKEK